MTSSMLYLTDPDLVKLMLSYDLPLPKPIMECVGKTVRKVSLVASRLVIIFTDNTAAYLHAEAYWDDGRYVADIDNMRELDMSCLDMIDSASALSALAEYQQQRMKRYEELREMRDREEYKRLKKKYEGDSQI